MQTEYTLTLRLDEACSALGVESRQILKIVETGIINPAQNAPEEWRFDPDMMSIARRALRLRRDLQIDWSTVALVLDLVDERDRLLQENTALQQRLQRFIIG